MIDSLNAAIATCNPLYAQKNRQRLRDLYCEYLFLAQLDMNTPTITYEEFTKFLEEILDYEESYDKRQDEKLLNDVKYTLENYPSLALSK